MTDPETNYTQWMENFLLFSEVIFEQLPEYNRRREDDCHYFRIDGIELKGKIMADDLNRV